MMTNVKSKSFKAADSITLHYKDYFKLNPKNGDNELDLDLKNPDKPGIKIPG